MPRFAPDSNVIGEIHLGAQTVEILLDVDRRRLQARTGQEGVVVQVTGVDLNVLANEGTAHVCSLDLGIRGEIDS